MACLLHGAEHGLMNLLSMDDFISNFAALKLVIFLYKACDC